MENIRIFDVCRRGSHVLGPGLRYVVWVQGCRRHCPGCITPESRPLDGGIDINIKDLAEDIIAHTKIDGLTISGGEPFLQAHELSLLLELVHAQRPELTVIVYTGYLFESLQALPFSETLLRHVDVLIDGEYIESLDDGVGIRGSSNQRIIPVSHRLDAYLDKMGKGIRHQEWEALDNLTITSIGIPTKTKKII